MPTTARCKECGYILYDGVFALRTGTKGGKYYSYSFPNIPQKIINSHDGKCPKCGRELEMPSWKDFDILSVPEFDFPEKKGREVKVDSV